MLHAEPLQVGFVLPQSRYGFLSVHLDEIAISEILFHVVVVS
jgi:hypothetical protein